MICKVCNKILTKTKVYCSKTCSGLGRTKKAEKVCPCGIKFSVFAYKIKEGKGKYCSRKCKGINTIIHKNSGQFKKGTTPWIKGKVGLCGDKNPNWQGGITPESLKIRNSNEYKNWRSIVFKRDNYTCIWCAKIGGKLCVDHIKPFSTHKELRFDINNGRTLCLECHKMTTSYLNNKKTVLVTGAAGFIGSYITKELLERGYKVIGVDDYSKYGDIKRWHDNHKNYKLIRLNLENTSIPDDAISDFIIHCASKVGGIKYFHERAYDLFEQNNAINNTVFAAALRWHKQGRLKKIVVMSSSMVYEGADREAIKWEGIPDVWPEIWPSKEDSVENICPPVSSYGHSKLSLEVQARAANEQYGLPYVVIRPFNASGSGEEDALGDSHVIPDLVYKAFTDPDNFTVKGNGNQRRCFTHAQDVALGTIEAMERPVALNKAYNISVSTSTSVKELAELIWKEIYGESRPFNFKTSTPFKYDVQLRLPDVSLARQELGFEALIPLVVGVREVIDFVRKKLGKTN